MAKDPAFLFYPSDFNDGTQHFTNEETGAYIRLLLFQFSQGHLPEHWIKKKLGGDFDRLWPVISEKFEADGTGNFFNKRLQFEIDRRRAYSDSRRKNISNRYVEDVKHISNTYEPTYVVHMENENENRNINKTGIEITGDLIQKRSELFAATIAPFGDTYPKGLLLEFFNYWSEPNKSKTKLRWEMEKTWDLGRRLKRWADNNKGFAKPEKLSKTAQTEQALEEILKEKGL